MKIGLIDVDGHAKKKSDKKDKKDHDAVNHPKHYTSHPSGVEWCITIARHHDFNIGNAFKYIWRAGLKTEEGIADKDKQVEDIKKAVWYINDEIKKLQGNEP